MSLPLTVLAPLLIVGAALVFIALERWFPYDRRQRLLRPGLVDDLVFYGLLQSYLVGSVIAAVIAALDRGTGWSRLQLVAGWPIWTQVAFFVVTHDLYIYLFHRLQHRNRWLWRIHEAHHATDDVDWISGARSHPLEILINQTIEFAPIILLGAAPEVALWKGVIGSVWGMYIHSNIDVRSGSMQRFINGPEMHRWHHASEIVDVNFATKLAIWDWLFGTAYHPGFDTAADARRKPRRYGLTDGDFPRGYLRQVAHAFARDRARAGDGRRSGRAEEMPEPREHDQPEQPAHEQQGQDSPRWNAQG
jgi:sterol desaturase/sphingolipid hydroxylase (fatty acid hydroxylase superfamily)